MVVNDLFNSPNRTLHLIVARKLSQMVSSRAGDSLLCEISDASNMIDGARGVVTRILPITRFDSIDDVESLANGIELTHPIGPANVWNEMPGIFYELALNGVQHSQSAAGCYVVLEYATFAPSVVVYAVGVADCGIGIPASLRKNPDFAHIMDDAETIARATELNVTGTGDSARGVGLNHVMQMVKNLCGNFVLISGAGYLNIVNGLMVTKENVSSTDRLLGTVAVVTFSA